MDRIERAELIQRINDSDLESGKVYKIGGQWRIEGKTAAVPVPVIKLPHYTEGTKAVAIPGRR